jgi:predicted dienelactone hydrolase
METVVAIKKSALRITDIDMKQILSIIFICYISINCSAQIDKIKTDKLDLFDSTRNRSIPINIYYNSDSQIKVIILSHGYVLKNTDYSFISEKLVELGYYVVAIQHDLPTDSPLARTGNIYELRKPDWESGVENINFVISKLQQMNQRLDFNNLILIGHSNGGDIP